MDIQTIAIVIAAIASSGALSSWITHWLNRGRSEQRGEVAASTADLALARAILVEGKLAEYQREVAEKYVQITALDKVEQRMTTEIHRVGDDMSRRLEEIMKMMIAAGSPVRPKTV